MFKRNKSYFADWRDADGARCRRAFDNRKAALEFEAKMKKKAARIRARRAESPKAPAPPSPK